MKLKNLIYCIGLGCSAALTTTSCDDMLDKGNDYVIYAGRDLTNPADTCTSVIGILNKVQAIAVRNNLLGEVRADLVKVNDNATIDLKNLSEFAADVTSDDDANIYNVPRDYYAVINNCNYYLAHADSTAGNINRNEKYFKAEIAQVHSIRAWVYLQTVLAYGRVPLVVDPVITKLQSDAQYPMYDLEAICDYFIQDLQSYYGYEYPDFGNITQSLGIDPQLMFFPTQLVIGDLYLYKAAAQGKGAGTESAKKAAKCYYDYIVWDLNGKSNLYNGTSRSYWTANNLYDGRYKDPASSTTMSSVWGSAASTDITKIPMDSAATDGYYNELRNLYCSNTRTGVQEACISPSDYLKELSEAQEYVDYDTYKSVVRVTRDKFTQEQLLKGYLGDLRYSHNWSESTYKYNEKEYDMQTIRKHNSQHITIYRADLVYLHMAEALNYAGYPRFARAILTMGLNNKVIDNEVKPFYLSDADQAFISQFDFNNNDFMPYAQDYSLVTDSLGAVVRYEPVLRANLQEVNMWGIHSRGSGLAFLNENYIPAAALDSTDYPFAEAKLVGLAPDPEDYEWPGAPSKPKEVKIPSTWEAYGNTTVDEETYQAIAGAWYTKNRYNNYVKNDSVGKYNTYLTVTLPAYEEQMAAYNEEYAAVDVVYQADVAAYEARKQVFADAYDVWYAAAYSDAVFIAAEQEIVDQAILDEQALELCYEGNRFFDLMRRALYYRDNQKYMVQPISRRTSAASRLSDQRNWYLHWKGQIGY